VCRHDTQHHPPARPQPDRPCRGTDRTDFLALPAREITVVRDGEITYITTGYTKQLEYLPTRFYPWQFTIDIESEPPRYGKLIP
jgi:hypothetical protein